MGMMSTKNPMLYLMAQALPGSECGVTNYVPKPPS